MERRAPEQYAGEPRCFICGMSPGGVYFPMCCDLKPDGTSYKHDETCATYPGLRDRSYDAEWLCDRCLAEESQQEAAVEREVIRPTGASAGTPEPAGY